MKFFILLMLCFFSLFFSQEKALDTLYFINQKSKYDSIAKSYVQNMIEANKLYLKTLPKENTNSKQVFVGSLEDLELIVHPVYEFKKTIINNDGRQNLINEINFVNNPYNQDIDIYLKKEKQWIWGFRIDEKEYLKIMNPKNTKEYFGKLYIPIRQINNSLDYYYLFKDYFSFYINDDYCVLLSGKLFTIENIILPEKFLKIQEFNNHFIPQLNYLKLQVQDKENESFSEFINKYEVKSTYLKVDNK